ncbi:MAG: hypothetical protein ACOH12_05380 [Parvibaculaceae bacterium]
MRFGMRESVAAMALTGLLLCATGASAADKARLKDGEQIIHVGETAEFPIQSSAAASSEFSAWCEVTTGGRASITFDGDHYVPMSDPSVGDVISFAPNETRRYELTGSVEANRGDAYIAFVFTGVPSAMCFPGQQCDGATAGAADVKVRCGNN